MTITRGINWRKELILVGLVSMEAIWLTALFLTLIQPPPGSQPIVAAAVVAALILAPAYLARALAARGISSQVHWAIMTAALVLTGALALSLGLLPAGTVRQAGSFGMNQALAILLVLVAWWRGTMLAQLDIAAPNMAIVHFWLGLSVLLVTIILGEALLGQLSAVEEKIGALAATTQVTGFVPFYFLFSLLTLALARIEEVTQLPESTASAPQPGFWLAFITVTSLLVVVAGLLLSLFFAGGGLARSVSWVPAVLRAIGQVLGFFADLLIPLIVGIFSIVAPVLEWASAQLPLGQVSQALQIMAENLLQLQEAAQQMEEERASGSLWVTAAKIILVGAVVFAVLWLGKVVRSRRHQRKKLVKDRRSHAATAVSAPKDAGLFQRGLDRLSGTVRKGLGLFRAQTIRRIYANLQRLAAQQGHPRSPQQTPGEYLEQLTQAWPEHCVDCQTITEAYVRAHYGMVPDSREELDRIRVAWQRIRTTGTDRR